jgi:hypothetical protein
MPRVGLLHADYHLLSTLADQDALARFLGVLDWFIQQVKAT